MQEGIGSRIRAAREARMVSLRTLARELEISPSALSLIERGRVQTPLGRIVDIARRLDLHPRALIEGEEFAEAGGDAWHDHTVRFGANGQRWSRETADGVTWEGIDSGGLNVTTSLVIYAPGASARDRLWSHPGDEMMYVLEGTMLLELGDERITLETGDSIAYSSAIPHRMSNSTDQVARHLLTTSRRPGTAHG